MSEQNDKSKSIPTFHDAGVVYNVTIKITQSIVENWLAWLKEVHIPEVIATGCFTKATILELMEVDNSEGPTYAVQYFAESKAIYNLYIQKHADVLREKSFAKWGNQFIAFRSVMKIVQ